VAERLSDAETAAVTAFVYSFMVNSFKGALMELLACGPCLGLLAALEAEGRLSGSERLYVGDAVLVATSGGQSFAKGADLHLLAIEGWACEVQRVDVAAVAEIKSYPLSQRRISRQIKRHLRRATEGLLIDGHRIAGASVRFVPAGPIRIAVIAASWRVPRTLKVEAVEGYRTLRAEPGEPQDQVDRIARISDDEWRITLRWSQEAIASAAFEMTFWYMEQVGEVIYRAGVPKEWSEMTPAEAGRNAVKMMLYYAILRARTAREEERAIALYNTYGFGYALGMSFRKSRKGRREMLWPQDLDEIAEYGETKHGLRFW
jgi:hypothetical protein